MIAAVNIHQTKMIGETRKQNTVHDRRQKYRRPTVTVVYMHMQNAVQE